MRKFENLEVLFKKIESINYENNYGGAYAYLQFLAYTRELLNELRPLKKMEKQMDAIEGINWLFNESLAFKFTHRQRIIFEEKIYEIRSIFNSIRKNLNDRFEMADMMEFNYPKAA